MEKKKELTWKEKESHLREDFENKMIRTKEKFELEVYCNKYFFDLDYMIVDHSNIGDNSKYFNVYIDFTKKSLSAEEIFEKIQKVMTGAFEFDEASKLYEFKHGDHLIETNSPLSVTCYNGIHNDSYVQVQYPTYFIHKTNVVFNLPYSYYEGMTRREMRNVNSIEADSLRLTAKQRRDLKLKTDYIDLFERKAFYGGNIYVFCYKEDSVHSKEYFEAIIFQGCNYEH